MKYQTVTFERHVVEASTLDQLDDRRDVAYWRSRPPEERFEALEFLRQHLFDYDPNTARLSGFFETVEPNRK